MVGGGVAGLEAILALRDLARDRARITLLEPRTSFTYRPLSVEGAFTDEPPVEHDLATIAADLGITHLEDGFRWLDPDTRTVHTLAGARLGYDALLLALGARRAPAFDHATTIDDRQLHVQFEPLKTAIENHQSGSVAMLVPSQPSWPVPVYELALMAATHAHRCHARFSVHIVTPEDAPLAVFGADASAAVAELLKAVGITLHARQTPKMHAPGRVSLFPHGRGLRVSFAYALPELFGPALPGVPTQAERGFISVDRDEAVVGLERVFAAGDAVDSPFKLGGLAAQQADIAARQIAALAGVVIDEPRLQPKIRAILLGGPHPLRLDAQVSYLHGITESVSISHDWDPADKVHAAYLRPYLESL